MNGIPPKGGPVSGPGRERPVISSVPSPISSPDGGSPLGNPSQPLDRTGASVPAITDTPSSTHATRRREPLADLAVPQAALGPTNEPPADDHTPDPAPTEPAVVEPSGRTATPVTSGSGHDDEIHARIKIPDGSATEPTGEPVSNIRTETLPNGIEVLINNTHPNPELVDQLMQELRENGGISADWQPLELEFGNPNKTYYQDAPAEGEPRFFAKVRSLPEETEEAAEPIDPESGRREIEITPKVRAIVASEEVQLLAADAGYGDGISLTEPIASYTDEQGRPVMIYLKEKGHHPAGLNGEEIQPPGSDLERIGRFTTELEEVFQESGIDPKDISSAQILIESGTDDNARLHLTDIEQYREMPIPVDTISGQLRVIDHSEFVSMPSEVPLNHTDPIIVEVQPGLTVIAVNDLAEPREGVPPRNFSNLLDTADHLIMQGPAALTDNTYTARAVNSVIAQEKPIMFFNEEEDPTQRAVEAGMSPDLAGFYTIFPLLVRNATAVDAEKITQPSRIDGLITYVQRLSQVYRDMPPDVLREKITDWAANVQTALRTGNTFSGLEPVRDYLLSIQETTMFSPEAIAFIKNLPGQKVLLIGQDHGFNLLQALRGESPTPPETWREFARGRIVGEKRAMQRLMQTLYITDPVVARLRPRGAESEDEL